MMATGQYTTLGEALRDVPDPRHRRGQRDPWWLLVTLIGAAVVSSQRHGRAIGQWVREHAAEVREALDWHGRALHLVSLVRHDSIVLAQTAVADKRGMQDDVTTAEAHEDERLVRAGSVLGRGEELV